MMYGYRELLLIIFISISLKGWCQKETHNWYFGNKAGLSFKSGAPLALLDGQISTGEGCATISDKNGNLLFYTDGMKIWNRNHQIMSNGSGLLGDMSSSQSAVIAPLPGNNDIYYVFTVNIDPTGLHYSVIDMSRQNGLGEVVQKNIHLLDYAQEKLNAVRHCNNRDVWVLTRKYKTDAYYAYLVTPAGISTTPVVSHTGNLITGGYGNAIGIMKCSPDGKKLTAVHHDEYDYIELMDFNNQTGEVSNPLKLSVRPLDAYPDDGGAYGVEFSKNSNLLYVSSYYDLQNCTYLHQFDLSQPNQEAIQASKIKIDSQYNRHYGGMQLGPDGKIYVTELENNYLSVIEEPEKLGTACSFHPRSVYLGNKADHFSYIGLPTFIQSYFRNDQDYNFTTSENCSSTTVEFKITNTTGYDSIKWDFGEPSSNQNNYSKVSNPTHTYSMAGIYPISLIVYKSECQVADTIKKEIWVGKANAFLGNDTILCTGNSLKLYPQAMTDKANYSWNAGSTNESISVSQAGKYWVDIFIGGCLYTDTIKVRYQSLPIFSLKEDRTICHGQNCSLEPTPLLEQLAYLWNTGSTNTQITTSVAGKYWLKTTDKYGCSFSDSVEVSVQELPTFSLGKDTIVCENTPLPLSVDVTNANSIKWSTTEKSLSIIAKQGGLYWAEITKNNCMFRDSIIIDYKPKPSVNIGNDTTICEGETLILNAGNVGTEYKWQDRSANQEFVVQKSGIYSVQVILNGCSDSDTINVQYNLKPEFALGNDFKICEGQTVRLNPDITGNQSLKYEWQDGTTGSSYQVQKPGMYKLSITNSCGTKTDSILVTKGICDLYVPNAFTPNGDGKNDVFRARFGDNIKDFKLTVYNRWGDLVCLSDNITKGWDGQFRSKLQDQGIYVWIIRYSTVSELKEITIKGTVLLLR